MVADVTTVLIPLDRGTIANSTSPDAFGAVFTEPRDAGPDLAEILVHECHHSQLNALLALAPIYDPGEGLYYSPARDDPRPIGGLLHGCYAFAAVLGFWRRYERVLEGPRRDRAQLQVALLLSQLRRAVQVLSGTGRLTEAGREFVAALGERLEQWNAEALPVEQRTRAESMAGDHYLTWRLRNLRYNPDDIRDLADARVAGRPAPPGLRLSAPVVVPASLGRKTTRREKLRYVQALDPAGFARTEPAGANDGDLAYLTGEYAEAARAYLGQIQAEPDGVEHWAGLALATREIAAVDDFAVLLVAPELVHAVHRAIRLTGEPPPDPWLLARWLAACAPSAPESFAARPG